MSTNTEQTENNVKSSESRNRSSGALLFLRVMICVLLVAVIALGALPENFENSAVATGLEKVSFHSNPKERQCQRMFKLLQNCTQSHTLAK